MTDSLLTDVDGDGDFEGTGDGVQTREHNGANELTALDPDGPGGVSALPFSYDKAGQMRELARSSSLTHVLTHDAWGRLVRVERDDGQATEPLLEQEYNGLHWRTVKRADTSEPPDGELDQQRLLYYSASWQLIEERIDDYEEEPDGTDRVAQLFWGVRYVDDAVLRRTDTNNDGDFVDEGDRQDYLLTDAQFSVVAVADRVGRLQERVVYDAYGMARHVWPGDVNGDGGVDGDDLDEISDRLGESIGDTDYVPEADLNRDGQITTQDLLLALGWSGRAALAPGRVSDPDGPDNSAGYCGYVHNPEVGLYTVRFRHYDPELGRWVRRDPLGYVDGMGLYEYVASNPVYYVDPMGLDALDASINFFAGFSDSLTFGLHGRLRRLLGVDDVVDEESGWYFAGEVVEVGLEITITGGGAAMRHAAKHAARDAVRREAARMTRHIPRNGQQLHHWNPLFGHPGGRQAMFPTGGLPGWLHSSSWNRHLLTYEQHLLQHRYLILQERIAGVLFHPAATLLRFLLNLERAGVYSDWCQRGKGGP
ncbi:MAG: RHS repeat-associated core domain-containing protein [Phycisphaeraceae bacterium]|nr:RHS repeat-associated core domain-containing protein [Phycisphaeraceae bacterium]